LIGGSGPAAASREATRPDLGKSLSSLFDLNGVYGSFLLMPTGDVAARALPEVVDDATLAEVGGRVIRLGETFRTTGIAPELCVLRFAEHKLYVKTFTGGALCVVTGTDVSMPALRMAANLVARKVAADLVRLATAVPPGGAAMEPRRASSSGFHAMASEDSVDANGDVGAPSGSTTRMYRGRPIG
jgi:predicted regulator of Ras-like GTPase activity (Roadblock/LC7/MglB family)